MRPATNAPPTADRRHDLGLGYVFESRSLLLGSAVRVVPTEGGNRAVLEAYVSLVGQARGHRPASVGQVRASDLDALAAALDLDDEDIRTQVREILGTSPVETTRLLTRLRQRRFLAGVAAAAALGGLVAAAAPVGPGVSAADARPAVRATASAAPATDVADGDPSGIPVVGEPLTVDDQGVGLIPPLEVDASGAGLVPAAQVDRVDAPA